MRDRPSRCATGGAVLLLAAALTFAAVPATRVEAATPALAIKTSSLPVAPVGASYRATLAVTGGTAPYSWRLTAGAFPKGLTMSSGGVLSGRAVHVALGNFQVMVTDSSRPARTVKKTLSLSVTGSTLFAGQAMHAGVYLTSIGGQFTLDMQSDGNLVEYFEHQPLWASNTGGDTGAWVTMQSDGNLVIYSATGKPLWASNTGGRSAGAYFLAMQPDSNVVVYAPSGGPIWASSTTPPDDITAGHALRAGWFLRSGSGQFALYMQTDGNLVEYSQGRPLWSSDTAGDTGDWVTMQTDGNLVMYSATGKALWASNTGGRAKAAYYFVMQSDANLVVYTPSASPIWASSTPPPSSLTAGQVLEPGWFLRSPNGQYNLIMQPSDGNLVIYGGSGPVWGSNTAGHPGDDLVMQTDGNLVIYAAGGSPLWGSNTAGTGSGNSLDMQSDGNLVVYNSGGSPEWTWHTQAAIDWANGYLGKSDYDGLCLQFVGSAYSAAGINIGRADTAADYWYNNPAGYAEHPGDTNPPVGALVFWGPSDVGGYSNPDGHVGIYMGGNTVISTSAYPEASSNPDVSKFPLVGPGSRNAAGYPYLGWLLP